MKCPDCGSPMIDDEGNCPVCGRTERKNLNKGSQQ